MNTNNFFCYMVSKHPHQNGGFTFIHAEYIFTGSKFGAIRKGILQARRYGAVSIQWVKTKQF